jgi:hypothetical protein
MGDRKIKVVKNQNLGVHYGTVVFYNLVRAKA